MNLALSYGVRKVHSPCVSRMTSKSFHVKQVTHFGCSIQGLKPIKFLCLCPMHFLLVTIYVCVPAMGMHFLLVTNANRTKSKGKLELSPVQESSTGDACSDDNCWKLSRQISLALNETLDSSSHTNGSDVQYPLPSYCILTGLFKKKLTGFLPNGAAPTGPHTAQFSDDPEGITKFKQCIAILRVNKVHIKAAVFTVLAL